MATVNPGDGSSSSNENNRTASPEEVDLTLTDDSESNDSQPASYPKKSSSPSVEESSSNESSQKYHNDDLQLNGASISTAATLEETNRCELKKLSLDEHGTFMADFHPEKSKREMRKLNRKLCPKGQKKNLLYDSQGIYMETAFDLCDCLDKQCPGCHFSCPKCASPKCGYDCRCNRKYFVDYMESEGTDVIHSFPL